MTSLFRSFAIAIIGLGLAAGGADALAQGKGKDKDKDRQEQGKGNKEGGQKAKKQHKHHDAKSLVGDKVKKNGRHQFHQNGKFASSVDVKDGKIAGVKVKHADKGDVPVKKYKTNKKMADAAPANGMMPVSMVLAQNQYLGTTWIGYAYYDEYGDEIIYWFPYDMILDGDTGAIEYVAVDY